MTAPRQILPGRSYLVTRRCLLRRFFLRPSQVVNQVFSYVLALASQRYGIHVHAYCVLSNHYHLVLTDPHARLPAFQQLLGALVARALNAHLGRWEYFWAPDTYSAVSLDSPGDVVAKSAYTLANPVAAGLVDAAHLWPGLWSAPGAIGTTIPVKRPVHFFDAMGFLPEYVGLELTVPAGFSTPEAFRDQLRAELARQEQAARDAIPSFLGAARVRTQSPFARPRPGEPRRRVSPRVAARDRWRRIELLQRLRRFLVDYRDALVTWRQGKTEPVFPAGTYLMRVAHGVACASG